MTIRVSRARTATPGTSIAGKAFPATFPGAAGVPVVGRGVAKLTQLLCVTILADIHPPSVMSGFARFAGVRGDIPPMPGRSGRSGSPRLDLRIHLETTGLAIPTRARARVRARRNFSGFGQLDHRAGVA